MNGAPLLVDHGSSLRLRVETPRGFKIVKWLKSIELVEKEHDHEKKKSF
jgi:methionine sulfoxide reductase catalytic subunit